MDRISALRNVEEALAEFEEGELSLAGLERRVGAVLRTYATEFDDDRGTVYRVRGDEEEAVVVAESAAAARERARALRDISPGSVEPLSPPGEPDG